jgi:membrane AbrB-like protein
MRLILLYGLELSTVNGCRRQRLQAPRHARGPGMARAAASTCRRLTLAPRGTTLPRRDAFPPSPLPAMSDAPPPSATPTVAVRPPAARLAPIALALALGVAGGTIAWRFSVPLAWMIGPMVATAAASLAGWRLTPVPMGRELGQAVVGVAIGLRLTPAVLASVAALTPAIAVATLGVIATTTIAAFLLRPLGRVDARTAFFATAAAGMADMALVARRHGGDADAVATVHAIRVAAIVLVVPVLVVAFGSGGTVNDVVPAGAHPLTLIPVLAFAVVCAYALKPLGFPNPWLVGPMLGTGVFATLDPFPAAVPWAALVLAQLAIGIALGTRFKRESLARLPRVAVAGVAIAGLLIVAAAAGGAVLSAATGLPFTVAFLSLAPAGITEMVLTAKIMRLDATVVTAFQIVRIAVIAATILPMYRLYGLIARKVHGSPI